MSDYTCYPDEAPQFGTFFFLSGVAALFLIAVAFYSPKIALFGLLSSLFLFLIAKPIYSYICVLFFFPVQAFFFQFNDFHKHLFFSDFFIICSFAAWVLNRFANRCRPYPGTNSDWILASFLLWSFFSLTWSTNISQGFFGTMRLGICFSVFLLTISLIDSLALLKTVLKFIVLVGFSQAILCLISLHTPYGENFDVPLWNWVQFGNRFWSYHMLPWTPDLNGRGMGTAVAHTSAIFLNMTFFFSIGLILTEKSIKQRMFWSFISVITVTGMISTLTKSTLLSLWVGLAYFFLLVKPLRRFFFTSITLLLFMSLSLSFAARFSEIVGSIQYTTHQLDTDSKSTSVGSRLTWWAEGMEKLVDTHGLGFGIGGFMSSIDNPVPDGTHPAVLFDFGLIGMFLWVSLFLNGFVTFRKQLVTCENEFFRRFIAVYLGGYIMMMIAWIVTLHYDYIDLYFYLAIGYVLTNLSKKLSLDSRPLPFTSSDNSLISFQKNELM